MGMAIVFACGTFRDIEVEFVNAELVKIDTIFRYPDTYQKVLHWRSTERNIQYVTYTPLDADYLVGSRMLVMVHR
jgi:hypothetical protein